MDQGIAPNTLPVYRKKPGASSVRNFRDSECEWLPVRQQPGPIRDRAVAMVFRKFRSSADRIKLGFIQLPVKAVLRHQALMVALLHHPALVQYQYMVRRLDGT